MEWKIFCPIRCGQNIRVADCFGGLSNSIRSLHIAHGWSASPSIRYVVHYTKIRCSFLTVDCFRRELGLVDAGADLQECPDDVAQAVQPIRAREELSTAGAAAGRPTAEPAATGRPGEPHHQKQLPPHVR